jgi:hypothetical protein
MNLKFTKEEKRFLGKWVLANSISWPVGIIQCVVKKTSQWHQSARAGIIP